jgi:hypothetical protein
MRRGKPLTAQLLRLHCNALGFSVKFLEIGNWMQNGTDWLVHSLAQYLFSSYTKT